MQLSVVVPGFSPQTRVFMAHYKLPNREVEDQFSNCVVLAGRAPCTFYSFSCWEVGLPRCGNTSSVVEALHLSKRSLCLLPCSCPCGPRRSTVLSGLLTTIMDHQLKRHQTAPLARGLVSPVSFPPSLGVCCSAITFAV